MTLNKKEQNIGAIISLLAIVLLLTYIALPILGFNSEMLLFSAIGIIFLSAIFLCLFIVRKYRKESKPFMIDYLNIGTQRYVLALLMILYGIDKLLGNFFDYQLFALDSKLIDVSEFQLAWFFYGKNDRQELFGGIMEFVPGLLLLHRKTYYAAAIILLPVTAQVFLLNFFFKIGGITFPVATILLACNVYIIYSQKEKIIQFVKSLNFDLANPLPGKTKTVIKIFRSIGILLAFSLIALKVAPVFFKSSYQKKYQSLVGVYTLKEMKKNNVAYKPTNESLYYKDLYIEKQARWNILRKFDNRVEAFILNINTRNDSINLYLNKGGLGDDADIIDSTTVLNGVYKLSGNYLTIKGVQLNDTLELSYEKQERIKPKKWFW
jgi:hypothetical protein